MERLPEVDRGDLVWQLCLRRWDAVSFCLSVGPPSVMPFLRQGQDPHVIHDGAHIFSLFVHVTGSGRRKEKRLRKWLSPVACPSCKILPESSCRELLLVPLGMAMVIRVRESHRGEWEVGCWLSPGPALVMKEFGEERRTSLL